MMRRRLIVAPPGRQCAATAAPGFTMIEVLVAVGVTVAVLLGIAGVFIVSYTGVDHDGRVSRATTYAHQKMEELRNTRFGALVANPTGNDFPEPAFTRTWSVNVSADPPPARLANVQVDVGFLAPTGRPATVRIQSQIAE